MKFVYNSKLESFVSDTYQQLSFAAYKVIQTAIMFSETNDIDNSDKLFDSLGDWNSSIFEKQADIYWINLEGKTVEFIPFKLGGQNNYIANIAGKMITCTPDEGDIVYSEKDEALENLENNL